MHRANAAALIRQAWAHLYGGRGHTAGARRRRARAHSRRHDDGHSLGPLAFGLAWMVVSVVLNPGILRRISR